MPNCPITTAYIMVVEHILGQDVGALKGKTTGRKPHTIRQTVEPLPDTVMSRYRDVTTCADIMYINGIPLITVSRNIKIGTFEANWRP
jgi:hypothetical protein